MDDIQGSISVARGQESGATILMSIEARRRYLPVPNCSYLWQNNVAFLAAAFAIPYSRPLAE
jgi:hypothetical protein